MFFILIVLALYSSIYTCLKYRKMREKYLKWKEEEERIMKKDLEMSSA